MFPANAKYRFELYSVLGVLLIDISALVKKRKIKQGRNLPDDIRFTLDLDEFENYCRTTGVIAADMLRSNYTEVRVMRGESLFAGGRVRMIEKSLKSKTLNVIATGFLDDFARRFTGVWSGGTVTESFTNMTRSDMAWQLISDSQALPNGNFGIQLGPHQHTGSLYSKEYERANIREAIKAMTEYQAGPIDIEFTPNKLFNTYLRIGSERPEMVFEFGKNVIDIDQSDDGTNVINEVFGVAQELAGGAQITDTEIRNTSAANNFLQQDVLMSNATTNADNGLTDDINRQLDIYQNPYTLPRLVVDGNKEPFVTDYSIGDSVTVKGPSQYSMFNTINGVFRVEAREIDISDEDSETVYLDVTGDTTPVNSTRYKVSRKMENTVSYLEQQLRDIKIKL